MIPIAPDIWHVPVAPLKFPGGARMPLASTVIRLPDRSLVLYSPGRLDDATCAAIDAEGEVRHIVAPSKLHHLFAGNAAQRWPQAQLYGAPGLAAKRKDLTFHHELAGPVDAWRDVIDVEVFGGAPSLNEVVLFHRPSGTLVCADFVFNVTQPVNWQTRMVLALTGSGGKEVRQSRFFTFGVKDRAAARASIDRILAWPIRYVSPVHGEHVAIDAETLAPKLSRSYGGKVPVTAP